MSEVDSVLQRLGNLCSYLEAEDELGEVLEGQGQLAEDTWAQLAEAAGRGETGDLRRLLDAVDAAGRAAGLDGITYTTREYRPLPLPGPPVRHRTVAGWRCPHPVRCGRVELGADQRDEHRCTLTGDPMTWVSVSSG